MRDLLATCPEDKKKRYQKLADQALNGSRASAVKIKCLECCAWQYAESRTCQITDCALHGFGGQKGG